MVFPAPPAVWVATHVDAVVQTSDVGRCSWAKKPGDTGSLVLHSSKMFYKEWLSWNPHNGSTNPRYCVNNHLQVSKYNYISNSSVVHYIHCNGKCGHRRGYLGVTKRLLLRSAKGKLEFMRMFQTSKMFGSWIQLSELLQEIGCPSWYLKKELGLSAPPLESFNCGKCECS